MVFDTLAGKDAPMVVSENGGKQSYTPCRFDLIPPEELADAARVLGEGAVKYGEYNWQKLPTDDHLNHAIQHIYAHLAGDTSDEHLTHAVVRLLFAAFTCKREGKPARNLVDGQAFDNLLAYSSGLEQKIAELETRLPRSGFFPASELGTVQTETSILDDCFSP